MPQVAPFSVSSLNSDPAKESRFNKAYNPIFSGTAIRSRGPFFTYLLGEKGFTYEQAKKIYDGNSDLSAEDKQKLFDDFLKALEDHPVFDEDGKDDEHLRPDAEENCRYYAGWYNKAMEKIKNYTIPAKGDIKTPKDAYDYLNNFIEMTSYLKDIVQEYEILSKNPAVSGYMFDAFEQDKMGICGKLESLYYIIGDFRDLSNFSDKNKAALYPQLMQFIDYVQGKKLSDIPTIELSKMHMEIFQLTINAPNFTSDPEKNDPKYTEFLNTGKADFKPEEIQFRSVLQNNELTTVDGYLDFTNEAALEALADQYSAKERDYTDKIKEEKMQSLLMNLPYEIDLTKNSVDEIKAVHELYCHTAGNLRDYYTSIANAEMGKLTDDLIMINGRSLTEIVNEKCDGLELAPQQKQIVKEYEFVKALLDKNVTLEYAPYQFDATGHISKKDPVVSIKQYDKPFNRSYERDVDILLDPGHTQKSGADLMQLLSNANDSYHNLYKDSNRLTDSSEFKKMLGSFKEINELYTICLDMYLNGQEINEEFYQRLETEHGYSKKMINDLLNETATNCKDYITAKNADGKYRKTEKGNARLLNAVNFLNDLDPALTAKDFDNIKLKDSDGKKIVKDNADNKDTRKVALNDLMAEEKAKRRDYDVIKSDARDQRKRMNERKQKEANAKAEVKAEDQIIVVKKNK